jgi:hypothetical protein
MEENICLCFASVTTMKHAVTLLGKFTEAKNEKKTTLYTAFSLPWYIWAYCGNPASRSHFIASAACISMITERIN